MPVATEVSTHLNMRIDPKVRYLTELAARASRKSLTEYIEAALTESFKNVSIDPIADLDEEPNYHELTPAERFEKLKSREGRQVSNPLSDIADNLWSEYPVVRMQLLAGILDHLMSDEDKPLWNYIHNRKDLQTPVDGKYKLDREKIVREWDAIKAAFAKTTKGKVK